MHELGLEPSTQQAPYTVLSVLAQGTSQGKGHLRGPVGVSERGRAWHAAGWALWSPNIPGPTNNSPPVGRVRSESYIGS